MFTTADFSPVGKIHDTHTLFGCRYGVLVSVFYRYAQSSEHHSRNLVTPVTMFRQDVDMNKYCQLK
jgi:hypothetical protein